jgi:ABC-type uncharacterized transport system substrate-binding protein
MHKILEKARCTGIALFLLAFSGAPAFAHPHVWIDMKTDLAFDDAKKLEALTITWSFDEFYSAFAVQDFKKRPDGTYDPADLAKLVDVNLTNLKDWNYFTEVTQNGKPLKLGLAARGASSYDAKTGMLTMAFTVPLATPVAATQVGPVQFRIYDPSFYIAIDYVKKDAIHLTSGNHDGCAVSTRIPNAEKIWSSLPESAFTGPKAVSLGKNFATTATLICK